jgi:TPR repeat protein
VKWYRKAAEQGHANAQCNLGFMYKEGRGVPQDDAESVNWYHKAAEQGYTLGQTTRGFKLEKSLGMTRDTIGLKPSEIRDGIITFEWVDCDDFRFLRGPIKCAATPCLIDWSKPRLRG